MPKIAIVIPVYNEENNIEQVLRDVEALSCAHPAWNILSVVVNDGSTDGTLLVLAKWYENVRVRVIHHPLNLGIGCAVQTGFQVAQSWGADVTLQLDGDGQHPADQVPRIVNPILAHQAHVVVGSRYFKGAGGLVSTQMRRAGTWFFSQLLKALVGKRIHDTTSGFRAFDKQASLFISQSYTDDYPEVDAYVGLVRQKFNILEVPVAMRARNAGKSSITPMRIVYYTVKVVFSSILGKYRPIVGGSRNVKKGIS